MLSEIFAGRCIGNMHLRTGQIHRLYRVGYCDACVGVPRGIYHNSVEFLSRFLNFGNYFSLVIALDYPDLYIFTRFYAVFILVFTHFYAVFL